MKIKSKLVIMMISLVLIALFTASFISINAFSTGMIGEIIEHSEDNAIHMMDKINRVMAERISDIRALTESNNNFLSNPNVTLDKKIEYLKKFESIKGGYGSISIFDVNGIKIADTKGIGIGDIASNQEYIKRAIREGIYHDTTPVWSPNLKEYVIFLAGIIRDTGSKEVKGVLVLRYPLNEINSILNSELTQKNLKVNLVTNDGLIIYSSYGNVTILNGSLADLPIFEKIKSSNKKVESGLYPDTTVDTGDAIFVAAKQEGLFNNKGGGWFLITNLNTQDAFSQMLKLRNEFIIVTVAVVAASVIAVFILAKTISRPLTSLKNAAQSISKGDLNLNISIERDDEIGELASQFMKMQESIKKRTKDLQKTNMQLAVKEKLVEKSYQELVKADKAKDEFVSMVSHELRTPLVPVKIYLELLLKTKSLGSLNEKQYKALNTVQRSIEKLELLVSDVLDVFKLDLGKLKLSERDIAISDLVNQIITDLKPFVVDKRIEISTDIRVDGIVICDVHRIGQVFSNLVKNSIDFVPENDGNIIIRVEQDEKVKSHVLFTVQDNGIGIPPEKISNLFKKFYQIDTGASRKHSGTGLGLVICKGIIEAHGGMIWIDKKFTNGTAVLFTLPGKNIKNINESISSHEG